MRLPKDTQRAFVTGMTGSGKTQAACWQLSERSYTSMPWIVYDFKGDDIIKEIPFAKDIGLEEVPTRPGIYRVHPIPGVDDEAVETQMWKIWTRENTGVYIDEGLMIPPQNKAFRPLITQGRSKRIPMITLAQRPVWINRFVISEADFHQVFFLSNLDDLDSVQKFIPTDITSKLPKYWSYYYDVAEGESVILRPVPDKQVILDTFDRRLKPKRTFL